MYYCFMWELASVPKYNKTTKIFVRRYLVRWYKKNEDLLLRYQGF